MFFKSDFISVRIFDVLRLSQGDCKTVNHGRNFDALSFRLKADVRFTVGEKEFALRDKAVTYVPANTDYTRIAKTDEVIVVHFVSSFSSNKDIESFYPENGERYRKLFESILSVWQAKKPGYRYEAAAILNEIMAQCYIDNAANISVLPPKISASAQYLIDNFDKQDFSVKKAAEQSHFSEVYFRKLFKKYYGVSPMRYVINLRVKKAERLIAAGYFTLAQVAEACGDTDYKYFSVEFRKETGVSPSKYEYGLAADACDEADKN